MDVTNYRKSEPLVVLLNEIDILLTQTRLLELHVRRAQSATADRLAQLQEKHQRELSVLRTELARREQTVVDRDELRESRTALEQHVRLLSEQLTQERLLAESQSGELVRAKAELHALREQLSQLHSECTDAGAIIDSLKAQLGESHGRSDEAAEQKLLLEARLVESEERRSDAESRSTHAITALQQARDENTALHCRVAELEVASEEAQRHAAGELEKTRQEFETQLAELRSSLATGARAIEEQPLSADENERRLRGSLLEAQQESERLHAALRAAEEQLSAASQRLSDLDSRNNELAAALHRLEDERRAQEEEIHALRHKTEVQERELTGRHEALSAVELALHGRIQTLQQSLARSQREIEEREETLAGAQSRIECLQRDLEGAAAARGLADEERRRAEAALKDRAAQVAAGESARQRLETQIGELQAQLAEKQLLAERRKTEIADLKEAARHAAQNILPELRARVLELENRGRESDARLKTREQELAAAAADACALRERIHQLEALREKERARRGDAEAEQQRLAIQLATMQEEVREKDWAVARQQAAAENLALGHKMQLQKLDAAIEELQRALDAKELELAQAHSQAEALGRQLDELRHLPLYSAAISGDVPISGYAEDVNSEPARLCDHAEAEMQIGTEQQLRDEMIRLQQEAQQHKQILHDRNDELVRVKAELDQVQERLAQFEAATAEEGSTESDSDRMRTEFQAQLALLQAELSQKEWALEEHQAEARSIEQQLRQQIETLRGQVVSRPPERELAFAGVDGSAGDSSPHALFAARRRWNSGAIRKRRWRS